MKYGYARCSTNEDKQDIDRQIRELKAAGADEVVFEYEHGDAKVKQNLNMLLENAQEGDTIITLEVSRLTRSTQQLCEIVEMIKAKRLVESFSYETIGTAMGSETELSIVREGDGFRVTQSSGGGQTVRSAYVEQAVGGQVTDILRTHRALSWDGYAKSDPRVLDGTTFTLSVAFDDGTTISAQGANNYPKGLSAAVGEIKNLFDQFLREPEQ